MSRIPTPHSSGRGSVPIILVVSVLYFGRDFLLFRQGHRIPPGLLRLIAYAMVLGAYPIVDRVFQNAGN